MYRTLIHKAAGDVKKYLTSLINKFQIPFTHSVLGVVSDGITSTPNLITIRLAIFELKHAD